MAAKAKWDLNISFILGITFLFMGIVYLSICNPLFASPADRDAVVVRSLFLPMGATAFTAGGILLVRCWIKKRRADRLIEEGRYVWGSVSQLREIQSVNGLRGHPCVAVVCYTDPRGTEHRFQSRYLHRKPRVSIIGRPVKVYLQGSNYKVYYVDLEPLLQ